MPAAKPDHNETSRGYIVRYNWLRRTLLAGIAVNCTDIADHFGCSAKTAQRYINRLRADGYRIDFDPQANGFFMVGKSPRLGEKKIDQGAAYRTLVRALNWVTRYYSGEKPAWTKTAKRILKGGKHETDHNQRHVAARGVPADPDRRKEIHHP